MRFREDDIPLIFYNGAQSPYPFSLDIFDYFDDPLNVMRSVLFNPIKLIDVKAFPPDRLNDFTWFHSMVEAMKYIRSSNIKPQS